MSMLRESKKTVEQITHGIMLRQLEFGIDELEDYLTEDGLKYAKEVYTQIIETWGDQLGKPSKETINLLDYIARLGCARINLNE